MDLTVIPLIDGHCHSFAADQRIAVQHIPRMALGSIPEPPCGKEHSRMAKPGRWRNASFSETGWTCIGWIPLGGQEKRFTCEVSSFEFEGLVP